MTLKELAVGRSAVVTNVGGEGALRQHFLDMGVIPGASHYGQPLFLHCPDRYDNGYVDVPGGIPGRAGKPQLAEPQRLQD